MPPSASLLLACVLLAAACAEPPVCEGTQAPGTVSVLVDDVLGGTEGIAFAPDGRLFVSTDQAIFEVRADGSTRRHADVARALGLAWWGDALYVASGDDGTHATGTLCELQRTTATGTELFAEGAGSAASLRTPDPEA